MNQAIMTILIILIAASAARTESLSEYAGLSGCWEGKHATRIYEEQWMKPAGDIMLGMSRTVKDGKLVTFEFLRIEQRETGTFYIAKPSMQMKNEFKLVSFENQQAVFEDPTHDFPQRVIYQFRSADSLNASIEGKNKKGEVKKIEFPMTRVKCPGGK